MTINLFKAVSGNMAKYYIWKIIRPKDIFNIKKKIND